MPSHVGSLPAGLLAFGAFILGLVGAPAVLAAPAPSSVQQDGLTPVFAVPFPRSLLLLDVLEGTRRAEPRTQRTDYPEWVDGAPAFDPEESAALLDLLIDGSESELCLLQEMRDLAIDRLGRARGPPRTRRDSPPETSEVALFRLRLEELERLVRTTSFEGHLLLDGSTPRLFLFQPPPSGALQRVVTFDLSTGAHGLHDLDIAEEAEAKGALDLIDTAMFEMNAARTCYLLDRREFEEGPPEGGLREVAGLLERLREVALLAADPRLGWAERLLLDSRFQSDLVRLDRLAGRAHFEHVPLLRGGLVLLQGAAGTVRILELPDTGVVALRIDTDVTDDENARGALQLVDAARAYVSEQRTAIARAREQVENGIRRWR